MTRAAWIAIEAGLTAVLAGVREILAATAPAPEPPAPAPEPPGPAPEPPPLPPPPAPPTSLVVERIDLRRVVCFADWHGIGANYVREQMLTVWQAGQVTVKANRRELSDAVGVYAPARTYTLLVDGAEVAEAAVAEGVSAFAWSFDASSLAHGWHTLSIGGLLDGECCPTWFAFVDRGLGPVDRMPVCTGSYDLSQHRIDGVWAEHAWWWAPASWEPVAAPLAPRAYPAVPVGPVRPEWLAIGNAGTVVLPSKRGSIRHTFNRQAYYWEDATLQLPRQLLLDGPRGVGTIVMPTHIDIGVATQGVEDLRPIYNVYVLDPWRLCRVTDAGHVTTLVGWRHDGDAHALVGDWSAIPADRRGLWEAWGMAWVRDTLATDTDAAPIPSEDNRQPHRVAPACLITDTQHNRLVRVDFDARAHGVPPRVTEWMTGLADPWDIVAWGDHYLISERGAHRIIEVDAAGAIVRTVVQGEPGALVRLQASPRRMQRLGTLDAIRAQPCLGPEGLAVMDDWLYWGSYCQGQVRRVHLLTGELQTVIADGITDGNSKFVKLAVSDGTFGPRHAVAVQTWSVVIEKGARTLYLPGGGTWRAGGGDPWGTGYGSAVAIARGRMYAGSSQYGLLRYAAGKPWDRALWARGEKEFNAMHGKVRWGALGSHGMPAGLSPALDYYRTAANGQ